MTNNHSFALREQVLEHKIKNISSYLGITEDKAFMHLVYALLFNTYYDDPDYKTDVVDGSGDKQIDIIRIEEADGQATIHLVQIKNSNKYEGTVIVQMRDALNWIFNRPIDEYKELSNKDLVTKIGDIRDILDRLTIRNVSLKLHYVAKGDTKKQSPDFRQEVRSTENLYNSDKDFQLFDFKVWGVDELTDRSNEQEQQRRRIDVQLPIYRVHDVSSYLLYNASSIGAAVCIVDGQEVAKVVDEHKEHLFEENVRTYLGDKKPINSAILRTCTDDQEAEFFWFYNNGITVTCDYFHTAYYANPPYIQIDNMQIVNGCQTSMTLHDALKNGTLSKKTKVLLKVFATKDANFVDRITLTTNSQNAVSDRDLRSNDEFQRNLEKLFMSYGYYYERKPRMFKDLTGNARKKIISNEKVGQAYLAVVQHQPAIAMAQRSKIWDEPMYKRIFSSSNVDELLLSYLIYAYCSERRGQFVSSSGIEEATAKYGSFHAARIIGSLLLGENWRKSSPDQMAQVIKDIEKNFTFLDQKYKEAQSMLKKAVEDLTNNDLTKIVNLFKSNDIQHALDDALITY